MGKKRAKSDRLSAWKGPRIPSRVGCCPNRNTRSRHPQTSLPDNTSGDTRSGSDTSEYSHIGRVLSANEAIHRRTKVSKTHTPLRPSYTHFCSTALMVSNQFI